MSSIIIRRAVHADLSAIIGLLADDALGKGREVPGEPVHQNYATAFAAIYEDANQLLAVADDSGTIIGCLQISFIPGLSRLGMWRGQIESVRITPSRQGEGLGRHVFEWAIEECRKRGCGLVQLTTDKSRPEALQFYKSLGFEDSHEGMKLGL